MIVRRRPVLPAGVAHLGSLSAGATGVAGVLARGRHRLDPMVRPGRTGPVGAPAAGVAPETFARRSLIDRA